MPLASVCVLCGLPQVIVPAHQTHNTDDDLGNAIWEYGLRCMRMQLQCTCS